MKATWNDVVVLCSPTTRSSSKAITTSHSPPSIADVYVAHAVGWKDTVSLKTAYQRAESETTFRVVLWTRELREAR